MKNKAMEILMHILEIIDYQGDKNQFSLKFLDLIYRQSFLKVLENLPEDKKAGLDEQLKDKNPDDSVQVILKYTGKVEFEKALERAAIEMFIDYIQKVMPALDDIRKEKLQGYLSLLQSRVTA